MEAKMYSTPRCSWCDRVVKMLENYEVNVEKIDVSGSKELIKEMQILEKDIGINKSPGEFI